MPTVDGRHHHTQAFVDEVLALRAEGLSCGQIVIRLNGRITRNAVIGLCYRFGGHLPKVATPRKAAPHSAIKASRPKGSSRDALSAGAAHLAALPSAAHDPDRPCRWLIGDPLDFAYCGRPADPNNWRSPYCVHHRAAATAPGRNGARTLSVRPAPDLVKNPRLPQPYRGGWTS
jgi:hypothetical protein